MQRKYRLCFLAVLLSGLSLLPGAGHADEYRDVPEGLLLEREVDGTTPGAIPENAPGNVHVHSGLSMADIERLYQAKDYGAILAPLQERAAAGDGPAQLLLGMMMELGQGVEKDLDRAVALLSAAAAQNIPLAQHRLAILYVQGQGIAQDKVTALSLLIRAAENYPPGPAKDRAVSDRDRLSAQLDAQDRKAAQEKAAATEGSATSPPAPEHH